MAGQVKACQASLTFAQLIRLCWEALCVRVCAHGPLAAVSVPAG